jgi:hypothetical protein
MTLVERLAWTSVARGCAFGGLAIFMTMAGLAFDPAKSLMCGGLGTLLMTMILLLKANRATTFAHRKTEIWCMLEPKDRPAAQIAQTVIARARRHVLLRFALITAYMSVGLMTASLLARLI